MSTLAPNWFSEQMKDRITHIRQSRGRRLAGTAARGDAVQKKVKFPIAGRGEAYKLTGAIQEVKPMNAGRSYVEVDMDDYEASEWIFTPDLAKLGPNAMNATATELAMAIARREDKIQLDAIEAFAGTATVPTANKVGSATTRANPLLFLATKAKLRAAGDNGDYMLFCPLREIDFEQMCMWKQFASAEWRGDSDLPMLSMSSMEVRRWRGVVFFTLPDECFKNASGVSLAAGADDNYYTYMWASDAIGVESNWDGMAPTFSQHHDKEGSPYLGKVGLGGAAVGILGNGVARIQLDIVSDVVSPEAVESGALATA